MEPGSDWLWLIPTPRGFWCSPKRDKDKEIVPDQCGGPPADMPLQISLPAPCPLGVQPPLAARCFEGEEKGY